MNEYGTPYVLYKYMRSRLDRMSEERMDTWANRPGPGAYVSMRHTYVLGSGTEADVLHSVMYDHSCHTCEVYSICKEHDWVWVPFKSITVKEFKAPPELLEWVGSVKPSPPWDQIAAHISRQHNFEWYANLPGPGWCVPCDGTEVRFFHSSHLAEIYGASLRPTVRTPYGALREWVWLPVQAVSRIEDLFVLIGNYMESSNPKLELLTLVG